MSDPTQTVQSYIAMWNETDAGERRELVAQTVTEDASYLDPVMAGAGIDGISEMIGGAQQQFPGHRFTLVDGPDAHHDRVRFSWSLAAADGGDRTLRPRKVIVSYHDMFEEFPPCRDPRKSIADTARPHQDNSHL